MAGIEVSNRSNICFKCGLTCVKERGTFFVSHAFLYRGLGRLPWCIKCVNALYVEFFQECGNAMEAMKQVCRKLDLYWNQKIYERIELTSIPRSIPAAYVSSINGIKYVNMSYDDTLREADELWSSRDIDNMDTDEKTEPTEPNADTGAEIKVSAKAKVFWGGGFTDPLYHELEQRYKSWTGGNRELNPSERALYKQICILEATINRDTAAGKPIDKHVNSLNALLGSANLKPQQRKREEANAGFETTPFGVWIRRWEDEDPIPESPDENGIIKLVSTWFFGHISKLLGVKNMHSTLYEQAIEKYRVDMPEYEDEDDDVVIANIFGDTA